MRAASITPPPSHPRPSPHFSLTQSHHWLSVLGCMSWPRRGPTAARVATAFRPLHAQAADQTASGVQGARARSPRRLCLTWSRRRPLQLPTAARLGAPTDPTSSTGLLRHSIALPFPAATLYLMHMPLTTTPAGTKKTTDTSPNGATARRAHPPSRGRKQRRDSSTNPLRPLGVVRRVTATPSGSRPTLPRRLAFPRPPRPPRPPPRQDERLPLAPVCYV